MINQTVWFTEFPGWSAFREGKFSKTNLIWEPEPVQFCASLVASRETSASHMHLVCVLGWPQLGTGWMYTLIEGTFVPQYTSVCWLHIFALKTTVCFIFCAKYYILTCMKLEKSTRLLFDKLDLFFGWLYLKFAESKHFRQVFVALFFFQWNPWHLNLLVCSYVSFLFFRSI